MKEKKIYQTLKFETYDSSGDIYCLFYELATKIMASHNTCIGTFITSNKWLRAKYGKKLRNFLLKKANPRMLIDLGPNVFEAGVDTNILFWDNASYSKTTFYATAYDADMRQLTFSFPSFKTDSIWTVDSNADAKIRNKVDLIDTRLNDYNVDLHYGILTGANKTFLLDKERAEMLMSIDECIFRRIHITFFVALMSVASFAQESKIILNSVNSDGGRTIGTNNLVASNLSDAISMRIALLCVEDPKERSESLWAISADFVSTNSFSLPEGSLMLLKLDNDEIIEAKQVSDTKDTEDKAGEYDRRSKTRYYTMGGAYQISEDNIKKIISHSVVKVRVACSMDPIDYIYTSDIVSSVLRQEYELIANALSVKNDIHSNF